MFSNERLQRICDLVNERGSIRVTELSSLLDVSEVTIRRDLEYLSKEKCLQRTHGGAVSVHPVGEEITAPELIRSHRHADEKRIIAQTCSDLGVELRARVIDAGKTVSNQKTGSLGLDYVTIAYSDDSALSQEDAWLQSILNRK